MDVDWYRAAGTVLVVGFIGPLFWLSVKVLENKLKLAWGSMREGLCRRRSQKAADARSRLLK